MRKIRLDLNELTVESFHVVPAAGARAGTVVGQASGEETCDFIACNSLDSGCGGTCFNSCPESCMECVEPATDFMACGSLDSGCGGTCFNSCPPSCMSCEGFSCDC